jgi:hypothetical protein
MGEVRRIPATPLAQGFNNSVPSEQNKSKQEAF